jgi:DNA-binding response OmpR family regulator
VPVPGGRRPAFHRLGSQSDRGAQHVLIVEDDEMTALVMSEYLASFGYRVTVARNGSEGVTKFLADPPDLALVDVLLPRKDGFEVCFAIKANEHGKRVPVVLMSAVYRDVDEAQRYAEGLLAAGFMKKPFDLDLLIERVHELIGPP